jgi:hypothetical protein
MIPVLEDEIGFIVMEEWSPQLVTDPPCCMRMFLGALQQCIDVGLSIESVPKIRLLTRLSHSTSFSSISVISLISIYPCAIFCSTERSDMHSSTTNAVVGLTAHYQPREYRGTVQRKYPQNMNVAKRLTLTRRIYGRSLC